MKRLLKLLLCLILLPGGLCAAQTPDFVFSAEDVHVKAPVELPKTALTVLRTDKYIRDQLGSAKEIPTVWISAERLKKSASQTDLYMVQAVGGLAGANVTTFWLIEVSGPSSVAKILWTSTAHDVRVCYNPHSAYPFITALSSTADQMWAADFVYQAGHYIVGYSRQGHFPPNLPVPGC